MQSESLKTVITIKDNHMLLEAVVDPEGVQASSPEPPASVFNYPMEMKYFGLSETKLFHFHGIFKNNIMR